MHLRFYYSQRNSSQRLRADLYLYANVRVAKAELETFDLAISLAKPKLAEENCCMQKEVNATTTHSGINQQVLDSDF